MVIEVSFDILQGDVLEVLPEIEAETVQTSVSSPPYFNLRDYEADGQIGREETPEQFVDKLVQVYREVRRITREDGTAWLNIGDTYYNKSLLGIPWRVALALQEDGWILRSDVIWYKPNAIPSPVDDRPTTAHEYLFMLAKNPDYYYNADAIRETPKTEARLQPGGHARTPETAAAYGMNERRGRVNPLGPNKRSVWAIPTAGYSGAHFATFPEELVSNCILAGSKPGDLVLDHFSGTGTTGVAASQLGRNYLGVELNGEYADASRKRISEVASQNRLFV